MKYLSPEIAEPLHCGFPTLPPEITYNIVKYTSPSTYQRLAGVSRFFAQICRAQPQVCPDDDYGFRVLSFLDKEGKDISNRDMMAQFFYEDVTWVAKVSLSGLYTYKSYDMFYDESGERHFINSSAYRVLFKPNNSGFIRHFFPPWSDKNVQCGIVFALESKYRPGERYFSFSKCLKCGDQKICDFHVEEEKYWSRRGNDVGAGPFHF